MAEEKITVKLKRSNGKYLDQVTVPSALYPLNGEAEIYAASNTEEITDGRVIEIFDSIPFRPGFCYQTAGILEQRLKAAGYNAELQVGWLFLGDREYPVHHAYVVFGKKHVLDVSDITDAVRRMSPQVIENNPSIGMVDLNMRILEQVASLKNSVRVGELGKVQPGRLYIGSICTADGGMKICRELRRKYPHHKAFTRTNDLGLTETQQAFYARGEDE